MKLTVVPAVGSGLASMRATGQLERLFVHLGYYADAYELTYVTWGRYEDEAQLWRPFAEQTGARLCHMSQREWRRADVFRCMNLLATRAVLFSRRPFVMSYGADYPRIAQIHGRPTWKWRFLRALAMRRAAVVLAANEALADDLRRRYRLTPIMHHPNWVDCERFSPEANPYGAWDVVYVGRLVAEKNLDMLADMTRKLGLTLLCIGAGPIYGTLSRMGALCIGAKEWTTLPGWYRSAKVFALPSYTEGCPKALQEAMACGVACLTSAAVVIGGDAILRSEDSSGRASFYSYLDGIGHLLDRDWNAHYGNRASGYARDHWDVKVLMPKEIAWIRAACA